MGYHKEVTLALCYSSYINDLPHCLKRSKLMLFADDTNLSYDGLTSREIEAKLNTDLVSVDKWLSANKLTLNNGKTEFMIIGSRYRLANLEDNLEIQLGEHNIAKESSTCNYWSNV